MSDPKRAWTDEEIEYLLTHYKLLPYTFICEHLNRSMSSLSNKAAQLEITCKSRQELDKICGVWTKEEEDYLLKHYEDDVEDIVKHLGRSRISIYTHAGIMKIRKPGDSERFLGEIANKHSTWSEEEIKTLKEMYGKYPLSEIRKKINHSMGSIRYKAFVLDLTNRKFAEDNKPWTKEEEDFLKRHYKDMSCKEISKMLDRSSDSVKMKMYNMAINRRPLDIRNAKRKTNIVCWAPWSDDEIDYLIEHYQTVTYQKIAETLNRSNNSVYWMLKKLRDENRIDFSKRHRGIKKIVRTWTQEEIDYLIANYPHQTVEQLSKYLTNHSTGGISAKATQLKLRKTNMICSHGVKRSTWTEEELDFLKLYYSKVPLNELAEVLTNHTPEAIKGRAKLLKLKNSSKIEREQGYFSCIDCGKKVYFDDKLNADGPHRGKRCHTCHLNHYRLYWRGKSNNGYRQFLEEQKQKHDLIEQKRNETKDKIYTCTKCKKEKRGEEFSFETTRLRRRSYCKECARLENEKYRNKRLGLQE